MEKSTFDPNSFLNVKEMSPREDLMVKGGGDDKKKDKKKEEDKESKLDIDSMFYINLLIKTATVA